MKQLVRLKRRSSCDGNSFMYFLDYVDEGGKRRRISLGHADQKKAEKQQKGKEQELRMGIVVPLSMKLSEFVQDSLERSGEQIRESTKEDYHSAMQDFIDTVGNIDYQKVTFRHSEQFRQALLDKGNRPATVAKKLREVKAFFNLAVSRKQLEDNPFRHTKAPKAEKKNIEVYKSDECQRILKAARESQTAEGLNWELFILTAVTTGLRKSELLNATWRDIDFSALTITVCSKEDTAGTWKWFVKDTDSRVLPITKDICSLLAEHQANQPEGYPYVFVPPKRYDHIQQLRKQGKWTLINARKKIIQNFRTKFISILKKANVRQRKFHDLRSTALSNWLYGGLRELDVMRLAGHSKFETTHRFYLAVSDDLLAKARVATEKNLSENLAHIWHAPPAEAQKERSQHA
jgi:integrase